MNKNMKKYVMMVVAALFLGSCENTNEDLVQERGVAVTPIMSEPFPASFTSDLENSYVVFDLSLPEGTSIDKAEIEVVYKDKKVILKAVTIPVAGLKITANELIAALGISEGDVEVGDVFYLYVLATKGGKATRSIAAMKITVFCAFDTDLTAGNYNFESADWDVEGTVTLEADPNDPYKITLVDYPEAEGLETVNGNRIVLNINPNTYGVSGSKVILAADLGDWGLSNYTNYAYEAVSGSYDPCTGTYTVTFVISLDQGSYGSNVFVFTRP
jgi:hypothetical protein